MLLHDRSLAGVEPMNIRSFQPADRAGITAVQTASWQSTYRGMLPDHFLNHEVENELAGYWSNLETLPQDLVLIAEDSAIKGFISIWCRPDPFIDNLHIMPQCKSGGIGSQLMAAAAKELVFRGHSGVYLWVMCNNGPAIRFYEKLGGVRTQTEHKDIFGHKVPCIRFEWTNLSIIPARALSPPRSHQALRP